MSEPTGYLWRKYNWGEEYHLGSEGAVWKLWPALDTGQLGHLNRWEKLGTAFLGFASFGCFPVSCTVYEYTMVLKLVLSEGFYKASHPQLDAVSAVEIVKHTHLNVWFGDRTPFLASRYPDYDQVVASALQEIFPAVAFVP